MHERAGRPRRAETSVPSILSKESRLLWLTARSDVPAESISALVSAGLDWQRVAWLAEVERAAPVVQAALDGAVGRARLPAEANVLLRLSMVEHLHLQATAQRLGDVVGRLADADIDVMLLKGAAMAAGVYGSFEERPMSDLDMLVDRARLGEARQLLLDAGWETQAAPLSDGFYARHQHLAALVSGGYPVPLELHGSLLAPGHPFALDERELWRTSSREPVGSGTAQLPAPEWLVLHACLHFAWAHALTSAAWRTFRDIDAVARRCSSFDWERFGALAVRTRAASASYWTLRLGETLSELAVPEHVLEGLRPRQPDWQLRLLERHFAFRVSHLEGSCPSVLIGRAMWRKAVGRGMPAGSEPWRHGDEFPRAQWAGTGSGGSASGQYTAKAAWPAQLLRHSRQLGEWGRYAHTILTADPRLRSRG